MQMRPIIVRKSRASSVTKLDGRLRSSNTMALSEEFAVKRI